MVGSPLTPDPRKIRACPIWENSATANAIGDSTVLPLSLAAIAKLTGMKAENVRKLLRKMVASGEIIQSRVGFNTVLYSKPTTE